MKTTVNDLAKSLAAPFLAPLQRGLDALYACQTSSDALPGLPGGKDITNGSTGEDIIPCETKFSSLLSEVMSEVCSAMLPLAGGASIDSKLQKTVNRAGVN